MRWKYLVLPLWLAGFGCASSSTNARDGEHVAAKSEQAEPGGPKKTAPAGEQVASAETDKDAPVCTMEQVIGSNMRKRVCRSREQIEREKREAQDIARRAQQGAGGSTNNSGGR